MKESLFQGMEPDEKDSLKEEFIKAHLFRKGLKKVLERKLENAYNVLSNPKYENPNWINEQTDQIGYIKALKQMISLLD